MKTSKKYESKFGWSYPPGSSYDPNAPYNQDDYIFDKGSDIIYDYFIKNGFSEYDAEILTDKFINDDLYLKLVELYNVPIDIGWDYENNEPIYSDEYKEIEKQAYKLFKDYKSRNAYIHSELFKKTIENILDSTEFKKWLKENSVDIDNIDNDDDHLNIKKFESFIETLPIKDNEIDAIDFDDVYVIVHKNKKYSLALGEKLFLTIEEAKNAIKNDPNLFNSCKVITLTEYINEIRDTSFESDIDSHYL